jgi:hypothetical protein
MRRSLLSLLLLLFLLAGCARASSGDDDTTAADDDSGSADDDDATPADDDDDATPADDDDSAPTDDDDDSAPPDLTSPRSVLFIGNSHTFTHDLPGTLALLAASSPEGLQLETAEVTQGGATLQGLYDQPATLDVIHSQAWTYVVLQEQSTLPLTDPEAMWDAVRLFDGVIDDHGSLTTLFLLWARADFPWTQDQITDAYTTIGHEVGALVAPVGLAWEASLDQQPDLQLHSDDGSHPGPRGTYLSACVFLSTLYGIPTLGLDHTFMPGLTADEAAFLQQVAWDTVLAF